MPNARRREAPCTTRGRSRPVTMAGVTGPAPERQAVTGPGRRPAVTGPALRRAGGAPAAAPDLDGPPGPGVLPEPVVDPPAAHPARGPQLADRDPLGRRGPQRGPQRAERPVSVPGTRFPVTTMRRDRIGRQRRSWRPGRAARAGITASVARGVAGYLAVGDQVGRVPVRGR